MPYAPARLVAALLIIVPLSVAANASEPSLTAGHWRIVEMAGKRAKAPATMNFTRVRWLGLNTPCGPLWGWYRRSGAGLTIHITGNSRYTVSRGSPCQGVDYQLQFGRVRNFEIEGDRLVFLGKGGSVIARLVKEQ